MPLLQNAEMASTSGIDVSALRQLDSYDQHYELVDWFQALYFDPDEERRAGTKRNYRWPPSGPVDPLDELLTVFGKDISRGTLGRVAEELTRESRNWHARPDELPRGETPRAGRAFRVGDSVGSPLWIDPDDYRAQLLAQIGTLEAAIAGLVVPTATYSHNMPPGPLDDLPITRTDIAELTAAVAALRSEAQAAQPAPVALGTQSKKLLAFGTKIMAWSGGKADKFVDAALDTAGKTAGAAFVLGVTGLLPHIYDVAAAVERFVQALGH